MAPWPAPRDRPFDSSTHMRTHVLPLVVAIAAASSAQAQAPCADCQRSFTGTIGLGVVALPSYSGSDEYRVLPMPVVQLEYKQRVFVGGSRLGTGAGIGAYLVRSSRFSWDVGIAGTEARPE